jgi:D-3-phosphoglycerate dehydrogenase
MPNVIYLGPVDAFPVAEEVLKPYATLVAPQLTREAVAACMPKAVALIDASMKIFIDRPLLEKAPYLRVISTATTGADHIDIEALRDRHVRLLTLAGETDVLRTLTPAAELSWSLLMASARKLRAAITHVLDGKWVREEYPGIMLRGKRLGIIGCGRIGCWMARYGHAFDMEVVGYDPLLDVWPEHIRRSGWDDLLGGADFITLHVPLSEQTRRMIGGRDFAIMKRGAVFINTSRGGVVDENALLEALASGRLGAAALDVLDGEPNIDQHPLVRYARDHDNLIITPHIGGFSPDAVKVVVAHAAKRVLEFVASAR